MIFFVAKNILRPYIGAMPKHDLVWIAIGLILKNLFRSYCVANRTAFLLSLIDSCLDILLYHLIKELVTSQETGNSYKDLCLTVQLHQ